MAHHYFLLLLMLIGELARQSGISRDTIRYYQRIGLLSAPAQPNSTNAYKHYPPESVSRLGLIRQAKKLGFSLPEIAEGLALLSRQQLSDVDAETQVVAKLEDIDQRLEALQHLRRRLDFVLQQVRAGTCSLQLPRAQRAPLPLD